MSTPQPTTTSWIVRLALIALAVVSFAHVWWMMMSSSFMTLSYHGLFHAGSIYQAFNGIIPPTHPGAIGHVVPSYWAWYVFVAQLMKLLELTPLEVMIRCFLSSRRMVGKRARSLEQWSRV